MAKPEIGLSMLYCLNEPFKSLLKRLREVNVKHIELPDEGLHALNKRRVKNLKEVSPEEKALRSPSRTLLSLFLH